MSQEEIKETTSVAKETEAVDNPSVDEVKKSETEPSATPIDDATTVNDTTTAEEDLEAQLAFQTIKRNREKRKRRQTQRQHHSQRRTILFIPSASSA